MIHAFLYGASLMLGAYAIIWGLPLLWILRYWVLGAFILGVIGLSWYVRQAGEENTRTMAQYAAWDAAHPTPTPK
jgi:hypothetical protein